VATLFIPTAIEKKSQAAGNNVDALSLSI